MAEVEEVTPAQVLHLQPAQEVLIVILVSIFFMGLQQVNIFLSVSRTL